MVTADRLGMLGPVALGGAGWARWGKSRGIGTARIVTGLACRKGLGGNAMARPGQSRGIGQGRRGLSRGAGLLREGLACRDGPVWMGTAWVVARDLAGLACYVKSRRAGKVGRGPSQRHGTQWPVALEWQEKRVVSFKMTR